MYDPCIQDNLGKSGLQDLIISTKKAGTAYRFSKQWSLSHFFFFFFTPTAPAPAKMPNTGTAAPEVTALPALGADQIGLVTIRRQQLFMPAPPRRSCISTQCICLNAYNFN